MSVVICTLPNASTTINGVAFTADRGQMISGDIDEATAANFRGIPGYLIVGDEQPPSSDDASAVLIANSKRSKVAL